jgi:hypothetical protein
MSLLADAELGWIEKIFDQGVAIGLVIVGVLFIWRYGTKLIDRLILFLDSVDHSIKENTQQTKLVVSALEYQANPKGDPKFNNHIFSTVNTNAALLSLSHALRAACESLPTEQKLTVIQHLNEIERTFRAN